MERYADAVRDSLAALADGAHPDSPPYDTQSDASAPSDDHERYRIPQVRKVHGLYASPRDGTRRRFCCPVAQAKYVMAESFRFVEVEITCERKEHDCEDSVAYTPYLGEWMTPPAAVTTASFGHDGRHLARPLQFYYSLLVPETTENVNGAVAGVLSTSHPRGRDWYGPVLVLKCRDRFMDSYIDIDQEDLRDVWYFFIGRV